MRFLVFLGAIVAIVLLLFYEGPFLAPQPSLKTFGDVPELHTIEVKGQIVRVSVADTESVRQRGLSGRLGLAADEGMLFIFPQDGTYSFWMKDMLFSIDILWLSVDPSDPSRQATVVYIAQNVSPHTYPQSFSSDRLARYVLELPAGYVATQEVKIGDIVRL